MSSGHDSACFAFGEPRMGISRRGLLAGGGGAWSRRRCPELCRGRREPKGQTDLGRAHLACADLVRPGRDAGDHHPVHGAVRIARRGGEADAGQKLAPSLAESWSASPDGLSYDFVLRDGVRFHNGDPVTADDVKFSFERYRGHLEGHPEEKDCGGGGGGQAACPLQAG